MNEWSLFFMVIPRLSVTWTRTLVYSTKELPRNIIFWEGNYPWPFFLDDPRNLVLRIYWFYVGRRNSSVYRAEDWKSSLSSILGFAHPVNSDLQPISPLQNRLSDNKSDNKFIDIYTCPDVFIYLQKGVWKLDRMIPQDWLALSKIFWKCDITFSFTAPLADSKSKSTKKIAWLTIG